MSTQWNDQARPVYIVDGLRTPFLKVRGKPGPFSAADLAVSAGKQLLSRQPFEANLFDEVIVGCGAPNADEMNIARIIALRLGCNSNVPAFTVQRNCASGLQSIDSAYKDIAFGRYDLVLAGGCEAMSHAPLLYPQTMSTWLAGLNKAKDPLSKLKQLVKIRPQYFKPVISLLKGLKDPVACVSMGQTAEIIASRFGITRDAMDAYAEQSHARLANAQDHQFFTSIAPLYDARGHVSLHDDGLRRNSTIDKLANLKPVFDKPYGNVTAGNSSQVTDGAAMVILASDEIVEKYQLPVLAKITDIEWAAVDPSEMGLGPAHAVGHLLHRREMQIDDIDYWEINEAFAGQVLAVIAALNNDEYCRDEIGIDRAIGEISQDHLNVDGGAIAIGHPIGASGTRFFC